MTISGNPSSDRTSRFLGRSFPNTRAVPPKAGPKPRHRKWPKRYLVLISPEPLYWSVAPTAPTPRTTPTVGVVCVPPPSGWTPRARTSRASQGEVEWGPGRAGGAPGPDGTVPRLTRVSPRTARTTKRRLRKGLSGELATRSPGPGNRRRTKQTPASAQCAEGKTRPPARPG